MIHPIITAAFIALFGLAVWWSLPRTRRQKTRHYRNVLERVAERRTHMLVYWWLTRPERKRAQ